MKLGELNSAIRAAENLHVQFKAPDSGNMLSVALQKSSLLEAIKTEYADAGRSTETGFCIEPDGRLALEEEENDVAATV
jgi:hypothetical protein